VADCNICKRKLDNPEDDYSTDCGGDCVWCMAVVAEDPDCIESVAKIAWSNMVDAARWQTYGITKELDFLDKYFKDKENATI